MNLLPYENITYQSRLRSDEIHEKIQSVLVENEGTFGINGVLGKKIPQAYQGAIKNEDFEIRRIIGYENSFAPRIQGKIQDGIGSTQIKVKMKMERNVVAFLILWYSLAAFASVYIPYLEMSKGELNGKSFVPAVMTLLSYVFFVAFFKYESLRTKRFLRKIFEAEIK